MDQQTKDVLKSFGHNIERYQSKYGENSISKKQWNGKMTSKQSSEKIFIHSHHDKEERNKKLSHEDQLDRLRICEICHGLGIVKSVNNHVVHERNCDYCESEGILLRDESNNKLVIPLSQRAAHIIGTSNEEKE